MIISIHALREEGDLLRSQAAQVPEISIHALREEGDCADRRRSRWGQKFLSTPSVRRATAENLALGLVNGISIHALREEGDKTPFGGVEKKGYFYPRPP